MFIGFNGLLDAGGLDLAKALKEVKIARTKKISDSIGEEKRAQVQDWNPLIRLPESNPI